MRRIQCPGIRGRNVTVTVGARVTIHPTAQFGTGVSLGDNVRIGPDCKIGTRSQLGSNVALRARATLGERVHLKGRVNVGTESSIGSGCIMEDCIIEKRVTIGERANCQNVHFRMLATIGNDFRANRLHPYKYLVIAGGIIGNDVIMMGNLSIGESVNIGNHTQIVNTSYYYNDAAFAIHECVVIGEHCRITDSNILSRTNIDRNVRLHRSIVGSASKIGCDTDVKEAEIGNSNSIGERVIIRRGVTIPANWMIPNDAIVNPALPAPVVIPRTP